MGYLGNTPIGRLARYFSINGATGEVVSKES